MPLTDLLDSRLLLVTGKGGTGKSSLAAACGRLSAERGKRVVVAEVDSFQSPMPGLLGRTPDEGDADWLAGLTREFVAGGYHYRDLVRAIVQSPRYRRVR